MGPHLQATFYEVIAKELYWHMGLAARRNGTHVLKKQAALEVLILELENAPKAVHWCRTLPPSFTFRKKP
jgi:hypothetical protein